MKKIKMIFYVIFLFFLFARSAKAYVDPGTGSYLFQLLIAGLFAGLFFMKSTVRSVKYFFWNRFLRKEKPVYNEPVDRKNE